MMHRGGLSAVSPAVCQLLIEHAPLWLWVCCNGIIIHEPPNNGIALWGSCQDSVSLDFIVSMESAEPQL